MPPSAAENATVPQETPAVAPGLRILLRGAERAENHAPAASQAPTRSEVIDRRIGVILVLADAGLVGWPALWLHRNAGNIGLLGWCAAILSIAIGAAAGALAARIWLTPHDRSDQGRSTEVRVKK